METMVNFFKWCRRHITLPAVAVVAFIVYMLFFNSNSCSRLTELKSEINRLNKEIRRGNDSIAYYQMLNTRLETDPATLERIVREQYRMQMDDEDVFVVEENEN